MELKYYLVPITWVQGSITGWGNGYVVLSKEHPLNGVYYDDIDVSVHGGLTFSEYGKNINSDKYFTKPDFIKDDDWIVGFDTCHWGDNKDNWTEEAVLAETIRLKEQLERYKAS